MYIPVLQFKIFPINGLQFLRKNRENVKHSFTAEKYVKNNLTKKRKIREN